ncbi:MAG TPA: DUF3108 domain-containing protein [Chitinophagaceae bacterium]|nr:DUF3108 domain-containing protein [Chitinophagaceae bacterium]
MKNLLLAAALLISANYAGAQQDLFCGINNTSFSAGERFSVKIYYNLGSIYVSAGEAVFTTTMVTVGNRRAYHVVGQGRTFSAYNWIFKVRDNYETYIDSANLLPIEFIRNVNEGGFHFNNYVTFDHDDGTARTDKGVFKVPKCVQDVLSTIYYARNIDFDRYKPGDKIPFDLFLDDQVYNIYIRYLGKAVVQTRFGKYHAIVFKPLLIKGTIFKGGEQMTVWVSDDRNHIPLRVDSPISVGSIKADLESYSNLRYPLTSMISKR